MQTLQPISALDALKSAIDELDTAFNFERFGVPIDQVDMEHFRKALAILRLLREAQQGGR